MRSLTDLLADIRSSETPTVLIDELEEALKNHASTQERSAMHDGAEMFFAKGPYPMWVYDTKTLEILEVNEIAVRDYGYSREEFLSMTADRLRPEEDVEMWRSHISNLPVGVIDRTIWRHRRADDSVFPVEVSARPFMFGDRHARIVISRDITDQTRLLEQLVHVQRMESLNSLAANIAHDFNNFLAIIQGSAEIVALSCGPDVQEDIQAIIDTASRGTKLTRQLLEFSRKGNYQPSITDTTKMVQGITPLLRRLFPSKISPHINYQLEARNSVLADENYFFQIMQNLVSNARDAMHQNGILTISSEDVSLPQTIVGKYNSIPPGNYVRLAVADNGSGISDEALQKIFDPFFTTKGKSGTGLGLSVVWGIMKQHKGYIDVTTGSEGTSVSLYFPSVERVDLAPEEQILENVTVDLEKILVLDDEMPVLSVVGKILKNHGYVPLLASDPAEALSLYKIHHPPLVLTDAVLSDESAHMPGMKFLDDIWAMDPNARICVMSGYQEPQKVERIFARGASFIQKPFTSKELIEKLKSMA